MRWVHAVTANRSETVRYHRRLAAFSPPGKRMNTRDTMGCEIPRRFSFRVRPTYQRKRETALVTGAPSCAFQFCTWR